MDDPPRDAPKHDYGARWARFPDYAQEHPEVLVAVIQSAASDWAAARIGAALEFIGRALVEPEEPQRIVAPRELIRSR